MLMPTMLLDVAFKAISMIQKFVFLSVSIGIELLLYVVVMS